MEPAPTVVRLFQPTPPREGAAQRMSRRSTKCCFNPRPHARGRRAPPETCFNPRPRARGRRHHRWSGRAHVVSTHAPARGGDDKIAAVHQHMMQFQPTPPREGATWVRPGCAVPRGRFNPRPRARGRLVQDRVVVTSVFVSTHAPARGGDSSRYPTMPCGQGFNPRPRARGRPPGSSVHSMTISFQPTPPREGATTSTRCNMSAAARPQFQSTPPREGHARGRPGRESDLQGRRVVANTPWFQSTPPRVGATPSL